MTPHDGYPSDLSDERRALIEPVLTSWRTKRRKDALDIGRPPEHDLRSLMNAVLYVDRTGIPWRYLPHDLAPWATVYGYFAKWQQDGVFEELTGLLRRLVRESEGRDGEPSACVLDSQTIKTSANVHLTGQGTDAGKRIIGRKCHLGCDTLGLLLTVLVTAASVSDTAAGVTLLTRIATAHPHVTKAWVDAGYRTTAINQRRPPRHRRPPRPTPARNQGIQNHPETLDHRAQHRLAHAPPPTRPRLRNPPPPLRSHDPPRDDRPHDPPPHRRKHPQLARNLTRNQTHLTERNAQ